jgi:methylated-DNA-protein-cysteine methyltransferase-like protein
MPRALTLFERAVARVVQRIPRGTTLGYGEVALRAGKPRAARLAVRALNRLEGIPWWRVARSDGTLAPQVAFEQAQLLRAEGWRGPTSSHRKPYRKIERRRGRAPRTSE